LKYFHPVVGEDIYFRRLQLRNNLVAHMSCLHSYGILSLAELRSLLARLEAETLDTEASQLSTQ
jgi:hypothetical protein